MLQAISGLWYFDSPEAIRSALIDRPHVDAREPSFTAMWCAWARNIHATVHSSPIYFDTRSVQLVPEQAPERVASAMGPFSQEAADAATECLLTELATFAPGSEVTLTYESPLGGAHPIVQETYDKVSPVLDASGESFFGYYEESEMEALVRAAGFPNAIHHPTDELNAL